MGEKVIIPDILMQAPINNVREVIAEELTEEEAVAIEAGDVEELDTEVTYSNSHDYIYSAYQALSITDEMDTALLSKADDARVKKIRRQSLRLISHYINEIYEETFDDSSDIE